MTIATAVLDFSGDVVDGAVDENGLPVVNPPFKVTFYPAAPVENEPFYALVTAADYRSWTVTHKSLVGGGDVRSFSFQEALMIQDEAATIAGASLPTIYPAVTKLSIKTETGILNKVTGLLSALVPALHVSNNVFAFDSDQYEGSVILSYQTTGSKKFFFNGMKAGEHIYAFQSSGQSYSETLTVTPAVITQQTVEVRDYCTDLPIPYASVVVDGKVYTADANGLVILGAMVTGQTLPILITAAGYYDSNLDTLNNDELAI